MRFFIVDDDEVIRCMLAEIIEDYDLGRIVGEAENGSLLDNNILSLKNVDILIIDMLMPIRDGIQTVKFIKPEFTGKIIMLSQVENKEMIGKAYSLGVNYYITKPINRNEVVSVIKTASEHIRLKTFVNHIESSLHIALRSDQYPTPALRPNNKEKSFAAGELILSDMGIAGENGCKDLLNIIKYLSQYEREHNSSKDFPSLKTIFTNISQNKVSSANPNDIQKECKALEQRLRRTIFQASVNLASIGVVDYANPKFEEYAAKFFDFAGIRQLMLIIENNDKPVMSKSHINLKKFIKVLFIESKKV